MRKKEPQFSSTSLPPDVLVVKDMEADVQPEEIDGLIEAPKLDLEAVKAYCLERAAEVAEKVNPTNVFVMKYEGIANCIQALQDLCAERGHDGIPPEESNVLSS